MIYILTLANKPPYLMDAIRSVRAQTRQDFIHVVALDQGHDWRGKYPPAAWYNQEAKRLPPDSYISWLSDDDLLLPNYIEDLASFLDAHPGIGCCYGGCKTIVLFEDGSPPAPCSWLPREGWPIYSRGFLPACQIDGGMYMVRRSALDLIDYPYADESPEMWHARLADASVMNKIAMAVGIYPIEKQVMVNRITPMGVHTQARDGSIKIVDWREAPKWLGNTKLNT